MPLPRVDRRRLLALAGLVFGAVVSAQEPPDAGTAAPPHANESDSYERIGTNVFPFYLHERRASDQTEVLQVMGLFTRTSRPDGSSSMLLLPFLYTQTVKEPADERLYVFPFYFERESPETSFHYLLPAFFHHDTPEFGLKLLVPFWLELKTDAKKVIEDHVLFPLFRSRVDSSTPERAVEGVRFGIPKLFELWESRSTSDTRDLAAVNLFNFADEAQPGWIPPLFHHTAVTQDGETTSQTYLFPFYWQGRSRDSKYFWIMPFFGEWQHGTQSDYFAPMLLSHYGSGEDESLRLDLLLPLFHYARSPTDFSLASYLFFDYHSGAESEHLGLFVFLYRNYKDRVTGDESTAVLFPLTYFSSTRDGSEGTRWVFPYLDLYDTRSRLQLLPPFFIRYEKRLDGVPRRFITAALPSYLSFGSPDDYFSTGFPIYWAGADSSGSFQLLLPFFYRFDASGDRDVHVVPLYSFRELAGEEQHYFLGPLYVHRRFYDRNERLNGSMHSVLWPLTWWETRDDGYHYHFLPFFLASRGEGADDLLASPFYYRHTSPTGSFSYFLPFYARWESRGEERDFYAAGSVMLHQTKAGDGTVARSGVDLLWWMISFERGKGGEFSHQHVLPLLFWRTVEPAKRLTMWLPFYYSHDITEEEDERSLDLFLGNLFVDRRVVRRSASPAARVDPLAAGAVPPGDSPANPVDVWRDRGVLWPVLRWYEGEEDTRGLWLLPFLFNTKTASGSKLAVFPFVYSQEDRGGYDLNYFRYFFLLNTEEWAGGSRLSVGQLLFDWESDEQRGRSRVSVLFPFFSTTRSTTGSSYQLTPLIAGESRIEAGERRHSNRVVPIFWQGAEERLTGTGEWVEQARHLYLFPIFGYEKRITRADYYVLFPLLHVHKSTEALEGEVWPFFFYRNRPAFGAVRIWPFASFETGELAGDFWGIDYFFLSKSYRRPLGSSYRLDPFLFRIQSEKSQEGAPEDFSTGALFELFAYSREAGGATSYRLLPFVVGGSDASGGTSAVIPVHYSRDYGQSPADYLDPWRFFFLTSSLSGAGGERHFSVLTKLFEATWSTERAQFRQYRFLDRVIFKESTETSSTFELNPLFGVHTDTREDRSTVSILLSLYRYERVGTKVRHRIFWLFEI